MKTFIRVLSIGSLSVFVIFGLCASTSVFAATAPDLGSANTFSIIGQTAITSVPTSIVSGDVGMNASGASITGLTSAEVAGTIYATDLVAPSEAVLAASVQADASAAYTVNIPGLPIEGTPIAVSELNGITTSAGVYDLTGAEVTLSGGVLTLDGPGVYVFRMPFAFTSAGSINLINGARACDVFWNVGSLATINSGGAGTEFVGTILSGTGVHFGAGVTLNGRAFAIGGDVTMDSDTISGPTCVTPPSGDGGGGSSPRPRIHVEKEPTPSELLNGPGLVKYDYAVTNLGTISIQNIEVTDDVCSDVEFVSGDSDNDDRLDRDEEWMYQCTMRLATTTTNVVTAIGESISGRNTKDTDEATVVVSTPEIQIVPVVAAAITSPRLPNAGIAPREGNPFTPVLISVGILGMCIFLSLRKRQLM